MSDKQGTSSQSHESHTTTDHETIRRWAEERGGHPASVRGTSDDSPGILRIDFEGYGAGEEVLEPISWEEFFDKFEKANLAFLYQEETASGGISRFSKFVSRHGASDAADGGGS